MPATHFCGEYSTQQFGRTRKCEANDWQCVMCKLEDANQQLRLLAQAAHEACEHERAFWDAREQTESYREPAWLAELESAIAKAEGGGK